MYVYQYILDPCITVVLKVTEVYKNVYVSFIQWRLCSFIISFDDSISYLNAVFSVNLYS